MSAISQQPNKFNLVTNHNVWVLDSLSGSSTSYVLTLYDQDNLIVATYKQNPNPSDVGIFNLSTVLRNLLSEADIVETGKGSTTPGSAIQYRVRYGEEAGGVITYNGYSDWKVVLNGYNAPQTLNWPTAQVDTFINTSTIEPCIGSGNVAIPGEVDWLTNWPVTAGGNDIIGTAKSYVIRTDGYQTLSFVNIPQAYTGPSYVGTPNSSPFSVKIAYYNSDDSNIETAWYALSDLTGLGPRATCNDTPATWDNDELIGTIGAGPQNLIDAGLWPTPDTASNIKWYTVTLWGYNTCTGATVTCDSEASVEDNSLYAISEARFDIDERCTKFDPITLSFLNSIGGYDYYDFIRRNTRIENIDRVNYTRDAGSWSSSTFTTSNRDRGLSTFATNIDTVIQVSTDWLTDDVSLWMRELLISPSVKAHVDGQWESVVLTSESYEEKTTARNNKMFRHTLEFTLSNKIKVQR